MEPFLKWAGGKRWLLNNGLTIFPDMSNYKNYIEPFLGGGAIFFHFEPTSGYLSDLNPELINCYEVIRDNGAGLHQLLKRYNQAHCTEFYYAMRSSMPRKPETRAAKFLYLNRTCWNGLYRVNQKGEFNVPIGTKSNVLLKTDDFERLAELLSKMTLDTCDFEVTLERAVKGDFVFIDPPYTVKHNNNGFVKYNEKIFSWEDQIRLREAVNQAVKRGAAVLMLNADHQSIRNLYKGIGELLPLERASVIAGNSSARGVFSELAIMCY